MAGFKALGSLLGIQPYKAQTAPSIPAMPTSDAAMNDAMLLARLRARQRSAASTATPATLLTGWMGGQVADPTRAQVAALSTPAPTKTLLGQ